MVFVGAKNRVCFGSLARISKFPLEVARACSSRVGTRALAVCEVRALSTLVRADTCSNTFARGNFCSWAQQGNTFFLSFVSTKMYATRQQEACVFKGALSQRVFVCVKGNVLEGHSCMIVFVAVWWMNCLLSFCVTWREIWVRQEVARLDCVVNPN